jgi:hypothetical protein
MTTHEPPRLALALLERLVPDSAFLAGDLIEEYQHRQSRCWLWWEVLGAIAIAWCKRPDEIRPLRLVELQPNDAVERTRRIGLRFEPVNVTASPLNGIGGLGIAALALLMTLVMPGCLVVVPRLDARRRRARRCDDRDASQQGWIAVSRSTAPPRFTDASVHARSR